MSDPQRFRRAHRALVVAALTLTGCQGITGSPTVSQVRIIDASPDAPSIDLYHGSTALAYHVGFGNVSSYIQVPAGASAISTAVSGSRQTLTAASTTFAPAAQYTVLVGDVSSSMTQTVLRDQNTPAPAGQTAIRILDQSAASDAVDLYLVPTGASAAAVPPILTNQTPGIIPGYINLPAGAYKLLVYPAGSTPTATTSALYSGNTIHCISGSVHTIILLDRKPLGFAGMQAIHTTDYDPSALPY